jgi:hypothetical protein
MCRKEVLIMISKTAIVEQSDSKNRLKGIFEHSLAVLCQDKSAAIRDAQDRRIRRASLPLHMDEASLRKRALDDAAKALATLWKISEPARTKLPSRVLHYGGQTP